MELVVAQRQWASALDLGEDLYATELDALYLETVLRDAGISVRFLPWHPSDDVLTPLGAIRPLKVMVPAARLAEAQALAADFLPRDTPRRDVVIPIADAWVIPYYVGVIVRHAIERARERGGIWLAFLRAIRLYVVLQFAFAAFIIAFQS